MTNLESKVENLSTTNALMKEDLNLTKKSLNGSQEENKRLFVQLESCRLGMEVPEDYASEKFNPSTTAAFNTAAAIKAKNNAANKV